MNHSSITIAVLCIAASISVQVDAQTFASSTFDTGNEAWIIFNTGEPAAWSATGGNPGGYLEYEFAGPAPTSVAAPATFHGDWSFLNGVGFISYDHLVGAQGNITRTFNHQITLSGPNGEAIWTGPDAAEPDTGWMHYSANLIESEWDVTSGTWIGLLSDVDEFLIRYELYANMGGPDVEGIDNVFVGSPIPEPSSIATLAVAAGICLSRRRR